MVPELAPASRDAEFEPLAPAASAEAIQRRVAIANIVGMGGGGYPTAGKIADAIAAGADTVIANGMACEPGASADATLLREYSAEVVAGLDLAARCLGGARTMLAVPPASRLEPPAVAVHLNYPQGDERRLVPHLTGRVVPDGGYPTDVGVLVLNVATLFAIQEAVVHGRPPRRRIVSVGDVDCWIALGTPLAKLPIRPPARWPKARRAKPGLRVGGDLTGHPAAPGAVLEATTFSVTPTPPPALACIRCGRCARDCPQRLQPERLHTAFEAEAADEAGTANEAKTASDTVFDCTECGICTAVCPSGIDLVNEFRFLKARRRHELAVKARAEAARHNAAARTERLARREREQEARRAARLRTPRQW